MNTRIAASYGCRGEPDCVLTRQMTSLTLDRTHRKKRLEGPISRKNVFNKARMSQSNDKADPDSCVAGMGAAVPLRLMLGFSIRAAGTAAGLDFSTMSLEGGRAGARASGILYRADESHAVDQMLLSF